MNTVAAKILSGFQELSNSDREDFLHSLSAGLAGAQKKIPSRFFYDARGSRLFEQITELDEYYPTRCELEILHRFGHEIVGRVPEGSALVEFGSGSSTKTELLLASSKKFASYVPIDVSVNALSEAQVRIERKFPGLKVEPVEADFSKPCTLPGSIRSKPKIGFFPGSTIGNFKPQQAQELLRVLSKTLGPGSQLIVGVDLRKSEATLNRAYNDSRGITAAFNLNVLKRANDELGSNFDLSAFDHYAAYDPETGGVDMYLVSKKTQSVSLNGDLVSFAENETIHTEHSHKYALDDFKRVAAASSWATQQVWTDEKGMFAVVDLCNLRPESG